MAKFRSLDTDFFTKRYTHQLTGVQRLVYLYLKLNKHLTVAGCCKLPVTVMSSECGLTVETIIAALERLIADGKIAYKDEWLAVAGGNDGQSRSPKLKLATDLCLREAPAWVGEFLVGGSGPNADPRVRHPAIVAVRELAERYPPKEMWQEIIEVLGEDPDVEKLYEAWSEWAKRGYRPDNYRGWAIDWYANGVPKRAYNKKAGSFKHVLSSYQEEFERLRDSA